MPEFKLYQRPTIKLIPPQMRRFLHEKAIAWKHNRMDSGLFCVDIVADLAGINCYTSDPGIGYSFYNWYDGERCVSIHETKQYDSDTIIHEICHAWQDEFEVFQKNTKTTSYNIQLEQQAESMRIYFQNLVEPKKDRKFDYGFTKDSILWLSDYYSGPYYENDLKL